MEMLSPMRRHDEHGHKKESLKEHHEIPSLSSSALLIYSAFKIYITADGYDLAMDIRKVSHHF
jgi:hypothetical protein